MITGMITGMKNKLKSHAGASITFALLLFLVCAVISSVVIVAATAVGGRASKMAEMDQRYYAVNSAAELLRDVLEEQTVTVTTGTRSVSTVDQAGNLVGEVTTNALEPEVDLNGIPMVDEASLIIVAAKQLADPEGMYTIPDRLSLVVTDNTPLNAFMVPNLDTNNGKLFVDVSNNDNTNGVYSLRLTFKADITKNSNDHTTYGTPVPTIGDDGKVAEGKYKKQKTVDSKTVTTITWKLIDLQTVVAVATPGE